MIPEAPLVRLCDLVPGIGVALGEVIIADNTITGEGVVLAQRLEQLAESGGVCITPAIREALPKRLPFDLENLGERELKGFDEPVGVYRVSLLAGALIPTPEQRPDKISRSRSGVRRASARIRSCSATP